MRNSQENIWRQFLGAIPRIEAPKPPCGESRKWGIEALNAPSEVWYQGKLSPPIRLLGLRNVISTPNGVWGGNPTRNAFWRIFKITERSFLQLWCFKFIEPCFIIHVTWGQGLGLGQFPLFQCKTALHSYYRTMGKILYPQISTCTSRLVELI